MSHGETEAELQKCFESWDPMREDYTNSQFNNYSSGPGANLDPVLQMQALNKTSQPHPPQPQQHKSGKPSNNGQATEHAPAPYLVFKFLPKDMTKKALYNICVRYGRVQAVRDSTKNDYFFVDLATIADMESVYRALEKNDYGFKVLVGKQNHKPSEKVIYNKELPDRRSPVETYKHAIDLESRSYGASLKQLPRPRFKHKPPVSAVQYDTKDSLLKRNDPNRHFLLSDAHSLERAGLKNSIPESMDNNKYKYRTGRACIDLPPNMRKFIDTKHKQSKGTYNPLKHNYVNKKEDQRKANLGQCDNCQRPCDLTCARCSTFYCGIECRRQAWQRHRYVCGKPSDNELTNKLASNCSTINLLSDDSQLPITSPKPVTVTNTANSSSSPCLSPSASPGKPLNLRTNNQQKTTPRSGSIVRLTTVSKPNVVFIRSMTYDDDLGYFTNINDLQAAAKHLPPLKELPKLGQIVIGKFEEKYNRAMVLNTDNKERIKLVYIDYGNLDAAKLTDLYEAPERFVMLPRFAVPVILKHVPDCYMTEEIRAFMYTYLEGINLVVKYHESDDFVTDKGVHCVELMDSVTNQNFNKMILKLCQPVEPVEASEFYFAEYLKKINLPVGDNVELVVMDNSLLCTGFISCTTRAHAEEIEKFQKELQRYGEALKPQSYTPRVEEICIAKYSVDNQWYRGRCLELVGDGHPSILFFDYGNIAMVNIADIRRYPAQFTYPIYTCDCEIKGLPEKCSPELVKKLEEYIPNGSTIRCDTLQVFEEDQYHVITMLKLMKILKIQGLLKSKEEEGNKEKENAEAVVQ